MCGIIACRTLDSAAPYLLRSLGLLEYRGYDSVGVAVLTTSSSTAVIRSVHRVEDLARQVAEWQGQTLGTVGIGHTRWATHGAVTEANAHPHRDCTARITVVHNGIIENSTTLRAELVLRGHEFSSDVDSEVISHLVEDAVNDGRDLRDAVLATVSRLEGSWAIVVMDAATGRTVGAANGSPLVQATSEIGAFFASDVGAISDWVDEFRPLRDGDVVELAAVPVWLSRGIVSTAPEVRVADRSRSLALATGYPDFMGKEIDEQPEVAARILDDLLPGIPSGALWRDLGLPDFDRVAVVGCGTSLNAGTVVGQAIGRLGGLPFQPLVASEAASAALEPGTLVLAFSQSGETADVLRAIDHAKTMDVSILSLTNNPHSSLARRSDSIVNCQAGAEIGVAATKTFTAQAVTGVCVALSALAASGRLSRQVTSRLADDLRHLPDLLAQSISVSKEVVPDLIPDLIGATGFLFLGRASGVVYAAEGALKLKELTYRWAEAYPAGELKHGPLALVEHGTPVIVVDNDDRRLAGNIAEVEARGGMVLRVGRSGTTIPALGRSIEPLLSGGMDQWGPLEAVVPLQVLARELALALGRDVDKPRNLAKSVTVD